MRELLREIEMAAHVTWFGGGLPRACRRFRVPLRSAPMLQSLIVSLTPGQVTEPIPLDGGVALFQLRDIEETSYRTPLIAVIDYMTYRILAETPEETLQQAKQFKALTDTCDDLYGIAKGQPEDRLQRHSKAPADIPARRRCDCARRRVQFAGWSE